VPADFFAAAGVAVETIVVLDGHDPARRAFGLTFNGQLVETYCPASGERWSNPDYLASQPNRARSLSPKARAVLELFSQGMGGRGQGDGVSPFRASPCSRP
jgi:hypothetical protein